MVSNHLLFLFKAKQENSLVISRKTDKHHLAVIIWKIGETKMLTLMAKPVSVAGKTNILGVPCYQMIFIDFI